MKLQIRKGFVALIDVDSVLVRTGIVGLDDKTCPAALPNDELVFL